MLMMLPHATDRIEPVGRIPVISGRRPAPVQMHHDRDRQFIAMPYDGRPAAAGHDGRPREDAVVAPDLCLHARQNLHPGSLLDDLVMVGVGLTAYRLKYRWDHQR